MLLHRASDTSLLSHFATASRTYKIRWIFSKVEVHVVTNFSMRKVTLRHFAVEPGDRRDFASSGSWAFPYFLCSLVEFVEHFGVAFFHY